MPHRVRRYPNDTNQHEMIAELVRMKNGRARNNDHLTVPDNMSSDEFEEIMKKIDKHFAEGGVSINHPEIRGRITDTDTIKRLETFFKHIYAATNTNNNARARARNAVRRRGEAAATRIADAATARRARARLSVPRNAAAAARSRITTRNARRTVGRNAAAAALARTARRSRSRSRSSSRSRSGTRV
jgi:hypothetical protein